MLHSLYKTAETPLTCNSLANSSSQNGAKQTIKISKNNLDIIKKKTEYIVLSNNFTYEVNVCIRNEEFETKYYNDKIIEGGVYKTIVVTLGKGEGRNYWTILYPEYFDVSFEDVNTGNVTYDIWLLKKIREWVN